MPRQINLPRKKKIQPEINDDDEDFNVNPYLETVTIAEWFRDDDEICQSSKFGLSNIWQRSPHHRSGISCLWVKVITLPVNTE